MASPRSGGSEAELGPAFKAISALRPNIREFYKTSIEAGQLLLTGEVSISVMQSNLRAYALVDSGKPINWIVPKEGAMAAMLSYHVAKNSPNKDLCFKFINHALSKESQEGFCSALGAGPTVKGATLSGPAAERVPPLEKLVLFDWKKVVTQMADITDRWNREVAR